MSENIVLRGPDGQDHIFYNIEDISLLLQSGNRQTFARGGLMKRLVDRSITSVSVEDLSDITKIGDYAFFGCESLTRVELPNTVLAIGMAAFHRFLEQLLGFLVEENGMGRRLKGRRALDVAKQHRSAALCALGKIIHGGCCHIADGDPHRCKYYAIFEFHRTDFHR